MALAWDLVRDGVIDEQEWKLRWETIQPVGHCDVDGSMLLVVPGRTRSGALIPWDIGGGIRHFVARCLTCARESSAPNGRVRARPAMLAA